MFKKIVLKLIKIYQATISLDHGYLSNLKPWGFCRFHPTCSEYCFEAIEHYGIFKGFYFSAKRVLKCNPFNKGGYDPVR